MKKIFTLIALMTCFLGAKAVEIVDAEVDFTTATEIKYYGWGRSEAAAERLSLAGEDGLWYHSEEATEVNWDVQFFPIGGFAAEEGVTYTLHVTIKGSPASSIAAHMCGVDNYSAISFTEDWQEITVDYTANNSSGDLLVQCGSFVGDYWIKSMKVTHDGREQKPVDWKNILENGDASAAWADPNLNVSDEAFGTVCAWSKEYNRRDPQDETKELIHPCDIEDGVFVSKTGEVNPPLTFEVETEQWGTTYPAGSPKPDNEWQNQFWIALPRPLKDGEPYKVSFKYKASEPARATTQNHTTPGSYLGGAQIEGSFNFTTDWQTYESKELSASATTQSIAFNFGVDKQYEKDIIFYFDDIQVYTMQLKEGFFAAGIDAEKTNFNQFNFDEAIELTYSSEDEAYVGVVGTAEEDGWVNQAMVSTVYGHDKGFKTNAISVTGKVTNDPENWLPYTASANAKINFPVRGQWKIMIAPEEGVIAFQKLVGEADKVAIEINPNPTVITLSALERNYTNDEAAKITEETGEEVEGGGASWDSQFWIVADRELKAGEQTIIEFDYVASQEAKVSTQGQNADFGYMIWGPLGEITFTTEEQHFTKEFKVPENATGMKSIAFNMAEVKAAIDYTIKNVVWKLDDDTESLIDQEGTWNFMLKEGYGYEMHEAGTEPINGIAVINATDVESGKSFNLAGQRVTEAFKGVIVKKGKKVVVK